MPPKPKNWKILKINTLYKSGVLELRDIEYINQTGNKNPFNWGYVARKGNKDVVTNACRTNEDEFIFTVQPRLPMHDVKLPMDKELTEEVHPPFVIEFPAGVIDTEKGHTPAITAKNELLEEVGIDLPISEFKLSGRMPKSPGLTNESNYLATCEYKKSDMKKQKLESSESIARFMMTPENFIKNVPKWEKEGFYVASGTYSYLKGWVDGKQRLCEEMVVKKVKIPEGMCKF